MARQPEDWLDETPAPQEDDDEIIWVSKSEIKRDAEALKKLGAELVDLSKNELERIPLDEDLLAAIELAQKIRREGRRRQLQLIGKLLRARDPEPITEALDRLKNRHNQQTLIFHKLEDLRIRLLENGNEVIEEVVELFPMTDRQQLRALVRNAKKEKAAAKPPKSFRQLFQYLKELSETA
ncbi:ribosome-associated protein [Moellerella wisconsensis]|uniref:ribosome biogenesis factor YjgA n=1 Tax=Moellerella wisconsensis TaxID=158849 RepID=UPI001F4D79E6|nr:ribosome biogenesis factor YjgA [Moellerella wisconsensis]UNH42822.1 ribosome-associated protein [Moellerella wisconsensis]